MKPPGTATSIIDKNRLIELLENSSLGVTIHENPDGKITYANQQAISVFGNDLFLPRTVRASRLGMVNSDGFPYKPEEIPSTKSLRTGVTITGEEVTFIQPGKKKLVISTSVSPLFSTDGKVEAVISIFEDITAKKEIEDRLRYKSFLLDHVNDALMVLDDSLTIKYWNKGAEKIYSVKGKSVTSS